MQLEEFRAFELLRSSYDRTNYLLVKEAKVIAMTCTHAALKRKDLVDLAFRVRLCVCGAHQSSGMGLCGCVGVVIPPPPALQYDNVVMEEAAQILEVETFIPMMLQKPEDGYSRLKRVVLIGDHHQVREGGGQQRRREGKGTAYGREEGSTWDVVTMVTQPSYYVHTMRTTWDVQASDVEHLACHTSVCTGR